MSIRRRSWTTTKGEVREAWVYNYTDAQGKRRLKTFRTKHAATDHRTDTEGQLKRGTHVPASRTVTVERAGEDWIETGRGEKLEATTLDQRRQHLEHIKPLLGRVKLHQLTVGAVTDFKDKLRAKVSDAMVRRVMVSLGSLLSDAQARGHVGHNVVREMPRRKKTGQDRHRAPLRVGEDIPTPQEVKAILQAATGRWKPLLMTAALAGLRASELRGLTWKDVDLGRGELHVRQRADRYGVIGPPKSASSIRTVPMVPELVKALKEWKLACPKTKDGRLWLAFPNGRGHIEAHPNIVSRGLMPTVVKAGLVVPVLDEHGNPKRDDEGKPVTRAKYVGLHCMRHFFASWCLGRVEDGGRGLQPKRVQRLMGHSSIGVTLDVYGHLLPAADETAELASAGRALLG